MQIRKFISITILGGFLISQTSLPVFLEVETIKKYPIASTVVGISLVTMTVTLCSIAIGIYRLNKTVKNSQRREKKSPAYQAPTYTSDEKPDFLRKFLRRKKNH